MAVVGEAHIIVRAITTKVRKDIIDGFSGLDGAAASAAGKKLSQSFTRGWNATKGENIFSRLAAGLETLSPQAEASADKFRTLLKTGYAVGPALSGLVGAIGSVVASLGTLISVAGAAAPAVMALANAFIAAKAGASLFSFGVKGIGAAVTNATKGNKGLTKSLAEIREEFQQLMFDAEQASLDEEDAALNLEKARDNLARMADLPPNNTARREAELALKQAELSYRRAKDRTQDLNKEVAKGPEALAKAASSGSDPYAGLTESQKIFAQFLVKEVMPKLEELRETVASHLLLPLIDDIQLLSNTWFPILKTKLGDLSTILSGELSDVIAKLVEPDTVNEFSEAFDGVGRSLEFMGDIVGNLLDIFASLFNAAQPYAEEFLGFINDKLQAFSDKIDTVEGKKGLEDVFARAAEVARRLGRIIGNVFDGFGKMIEANFGEGGAGWRMLDWFEEASAGFTNLEFDPNFFNGALDNTRSVFSSIGELIKGIVGLADNPAIKETFDTLKAGVEPLISIIEKNLDAAPSLAGFVEQILKLADALTDTDQITAFWDTLKNIAEVVTNFFNNDLVQKILNAVGPIMGFTLAVGSAIEVGKFFASAWNGIAGNVLSSIGGMVAKSRQQFAFMTYSANPIVASFGKLGSFLMKSPILIAIGLLVGAFIYLYETSDSFREFVDTTLKSVLESLGDSFGRIMAAIQPLLDVITGELLPTLMDALQPILEVLIAAVGSFAVFIGEVLATAIEVIMPIIMRLVNDYLMPMIEFWSAIIELVGEFAKALMTGDWDKFGEIFMGILRKIAQALVDLFTGAGNIIVDVINWAVKEFFNGIGGGIADLINTFSGGSINLKTNPPQIPHIPKWTVPAFADGGIVYPSSGGTLARVAEAGRPERIEPLHPNGLSDRDIAIIQQMGGGQGINITVNPAPGMDEKELAAAVSRRLAFEMRKGTI